MSADVISFGGHRPPLQSHNSVCNLCAFETSPSAAENPLSFSDRVSSNRKNSSGEWQKKLHTFVRRKRLPSFSRLPTTRQTAPRRDHFAELARVKAAKFSRPSVAN